MASVKGVLHFRVFDRQGKRVVDADEKELSGQTGEIERLKGQLSGLWATHELTGREKRQVIDRLAEIFDLQDQVAAPRG